jgi:hypothetical protein
MSISNIKLLRDDGSTSNLSVKYTNNSSTSAVNKIDTTIENNIDNGSETETINLNPEELYDMAIDVIRGNWGNGQERKDRLGEADYDYQTIQDKVNEILLGTKTSDDYTDNSGSTVETLDLSEEVEQSTTTSEKNIKNNFSHPDEEVETITSGKNIQTNSTLSHPAEESSNQSTIEKLVDDFIDAGAEVVGNAVSCIQQVLGYVDDVASAYVSGDTQAIATANVETAGLIYGIKTSAVETGNALYSDITSIGNKVGSFFLRNFSDMSEEEVSQLIDSSTEYASEVQDANIQGVKDSYNSYFESGAGKEYNEISDIKYGSDELDYYINLGQSTFGLSGISTVGEAVSSFPEYWDKAKTVAANVLDEAEIALDKITGAEVSYDITQSLN